MRKSLAAVAILALIQGCALLQQRPEVAVVLEADRKLVASARVNVGVVLEAAQAAGEKPTTVNLLGGAYESLRVIQAGPIGVQPTVPWPAEVVVAVEREQRCEVVLVQDPAVLAALEAEKKARAEDATTSQEVHQKLQVAQKALGTLTQEVRSKWSGEAVAAAVTASMGPLGVGLLFLWRNRQTIKSALAKTSDVLQEVKGDQGIAEVVDRHAPVGSAERKILDQVHQEAKRKAKGESQATKVERLRMKLRTMKEAMGIVAGKVGARVRRKGKPKPKA